MTPRPTPLFLAGRPVSTGTPLDVTSPWDGSVVGQTWQADDATYEAAADACVTAAPTVAAMPVHARAAILQRVAAGLGTARETFARRIALEAGKPIRDARTEVDRARMTFQVAAEEARRLAGGGDVLPMDLAPHGEGRVAMTRRVPLGPIAAISPFNFPLNLVAHKLAPAFAAGNPVLLKPASRTPLSALALAELMRECGLPDGALSVVPMDRSVGDRLVGDDRFRMLTFTGSSEVGWAMKARAGRKKVVLELGGNAGVIVDASADASEAARRVATGGFAFAGQSCISVQRVYVHEACWQAFVDALLPAVEALRVGDPLEDATAVGPLITTGDVERVTTWIREATDAGVQVLAGGSALGPRLFAPTVLTGVPRAARVCADEVFGPVVVAEPVTSFDEAIAAVNDSAFGLQAGVFTADLEHALAAFDRLEVGGVLINDVPTFRIDHMPYGGVKDSGLGREGPRYTIEEMSELRLLIIRKDK
jgi:glyceraldehyde-3-phosphate dehydrogenase (NADP+)